MSPKNNPDTRQPAGDPPAADMSAISRGELEESEKAVEKLRDLLRLAKKDQEDAMPKIRQILSEHPDLAQRVMHLGRMGEDILIGKMTGEDLARRPSERYSFGRRAAARLKRAAACSWRPWSRQLRA